jgi:DNA-directed RNA polymerase subunit RPC12/RpoP
LEKEIVIGKCVRCGGLLLSRTGTKTKTCPYCNLRFHLDESIILARLNSAEEAKIMLGELKKRQPRAQIRPTKPRS